MCKRKKRDSQKECNAIEKALWQVVFLNEATRGPTPEDTHSDEAEADDDIVMFRAVGELFTAKEAVVAAIEVATALAFNNERGFEKLILSLIHI